MEKHNYKQLVIDILDATKNVEGAGLVYEVEAVIKHYEHYINTTPIPESVAKWVGDLYNLLDNCEGAGLERELKELKSPIKASA